MIFPELLGCVLACDSCEDLLSTCPKSIQSPGKELCNVSMFDMDSFSRICSGSSLLTWVLVLEFCQVVDIFVNDDPKVVWLVMRRYVTLREGLGHDEERGEAGK